MSTTMTRLRNLGRMAVGPFKDRGLRETIRSVRLVRAARRVEVLEGFDARFGTDTGRTFHLADLSAAGPDVPPLWRYSPTLRRDFEPVINALGVRYEDFVFVDLGSGKGRVLMMAADWPFRRVMGVELSPALHAIAQENLRQYHSPTQRCFDLELVNTDAEAWEPPADNLLVYLFQPFPEATLARVMDRLGASLLHHPRTIVIAYLNPVFERAVLASGWARQVRRVTPTSAHEFGWALYANTEETGGVYEPRDGARE